MNKRGGSFNVGASSILVIFVLLCLTTFSTLSLISANADHRLTTKAAESAQNYWEANNKAQQVLAKLDTAISEVYSPGINNFTDKVALLFASGLLSPDGVELFVPESQTANLYAFVIPVGDTQELYVEIAIEDSAAHFRRTAWLLRGTVDQAALEAEEGLSFWSGEEIFIS